MGPLVGVKHRQNLRGQEFNPQNEHRRNRQGQAHATWTTRLARSNFFGTQTLATMVVAAV